MFSFTARTLIAVSLLMSSEAMIHAETASRPNVLVVLTDDQGWGDLSLHGNPNLQTPNIDSLSRDGAELKNFFVCAVCSPTRAEFLTGRYHGRMGVFSTSEGGERIDLAERTIADLFKANGYATAAYGKWHSGMQAPYHPNARGFDDYYGFCSGHWGNYFSPMLEHNGEIVQGEGFLIDDLTDHAIEFISAPREQPFFVYLPLNTPHAPMQVPDAEWSRFEDKPIVQDPEPANQKEDLDFTRAAMALCENIDANVGRLLARLDELGIADDTIVLFFCDNGPNGSRFNGGYRGRKGSVYEGGLRSPGLIRYPTVIKPGTVVETISGAIDILPTMAEFCGVPIEGTAGPLDGISMADSLRSGATAGLDKRLIFTSWSKGSSVRSQRWRYHRDGSLYDLDADPGEKSNVAEAHPAVAQRLAGRLDGWLKELKPRPSKGEADPDRPFTAGDADFEWTQLPARDAAPIGGLRRSNRHPNCTYMTGWTKETDAIVWDLQIVDPGIFDVTMYYACPPSAVGTRLDLSMVDSTGDILDQTTATVTTARVSDFLNVEFDRTPRPEGYEKDWATMSLGTLTLPAGLGQLRLTAPNIEGDDGVEMRLLMLHRQ